MKKPFWVFLTMLFFIGQGFAQTNATNFKVKDCNNVEHDLFQELDSGKVIVITWVMPCGVCIKPTATASTAVSTFKDSLPGRVKFYVADDYANTNCSSLSGWMSSFSISFDAIFSNSNVKMSDYGIDGMPKTIVLGGKDHKVILNTNGEVTHEGMKAAIAQAVEAALSAEKGISKPKFSLNPNPSKGIVNLTVATVANFANIKSIEILNVSGKIVGVQEKADLNVGKEIALNVAGLQAGMYFVKVTSSIEVHTLYLVIE